MRAVSSEKAQRFATFPLPDDRLRASDPVPLNVIGKEVCGSRIAVRGSVLPLLHQSRVRVLGHRSVLRE